METSSIVTVFTPIMPLFVELCKWIWPKVNPRYFSAGFSFGIALILGALRFFAKDSFDSIVTSMGLVATFVFGVGTGLYQLQK